MIGKINIFGPIGKYEKDGKLEGVAVIDVIEQVKKLSPDTQVIDVCIASPGGYVEEGDNIYSYLESLKKTFVVNTTQAGHIASIATKLFLVGQIRTGNPSFNFMIHNPWNDPGPGDSKYQQENLEGLLIEEDKLRKFYSKMLGITEEGLSPLMDQETNISPTQLVTLGFATNLTTNKLVMAMKKNDGKSPSLLNRAMALMNQIKGAAKVQSFDVPLMDGTVLTVDAPNEDSLVGATATIDGAPAPDGDYVAMPDDEDGSQGDTLTVKGGVVTAVTEPAQAKEQNSKIENLEKVVSKLVDSVSALVEAAKLNKSEAVTEAVAEAEKKAEARIFALKNEIGTTHEPRRASVVYAETVDKNATGHRSIAQVMKEKELARKNKK